MEFAQLATKIEPWPTLDGYPDSQAQPGLRFSISQRGRPVPRLLREPKPLYSPSIVVRPIFGKVFIDS